MILPPPQQATEIEELVLGTLLSKPKAIYELNYLSEHHFFKPQNKEVYKAIKTASIESRIDVFTVAENIIKQGFKTEKRELYIILSELSNNYSPEIDVHSRILVEKWMLREISNIAQIALRDTFKADADCFNVIDYIYQSITDIRNSINVGSEQEMSQIIADFYQKLENMKNGLQNGVTCSIMDMDFHLGGYQKGKMYVVAGRPAMGKSALMVNDILAACRQGLSVVVHNLEMTNEDLLVRLISLIIREPYGQIQNGIIKNYEAFRNATAEVAKFKIKVFTSTRLTDIILNTKMVASTVGVDVVFVDYLQFAKVQGAKRREEVSETSRSMKVLAKELDVPVIALAQLGRDVENNHLKIPMLSNLKESGDIEQDADVVAFIWRPEYYKIDFHDFGMGEESTEGRAVIIVAKNRGGSTGEVLVNWDGANNRFYN